MESPVVPPFQDASKQIRLLKRKVAETDILDFEVTIWDVGSLPEYHAISYTWGSPTDLASVRIEGEPFEVRRNCYYTLWHVGLHFPNEYIWIDSVCIDQMSSNEMNQQVQMMGSIYSAAKAVVVCIGPHGNGSELLHGRSTIQEPLKFENADKAALWKVLRSFWHRTYWNRLWIVQELELAKHVHLLCGEHVLDFRDFSLLPWRDDWAEHCPGMPGLGLDVLRQRHIEVPLWDAINQNMHQLCQNPLDHVFAVLSIAIPGSSRPPIQVDYSVDPYELVLDVMERRTGPINGQYPTQFQTLLSLLGLRSMPGMTSLLAKGGSVMQSATCGFSFDHHLLAAHKDHFPIDVEVAGVVEHLPRTCKVATLDAGPNANLVVRPFQKSDLYGQKLPTLLKNGVSAHKKYIMSESACVTEVSFAMTIGEDVYSAIARVSSSARPGDLLLRTGLHIFAQPDMVLDLGVSGRYDAGNERAAGSEQLVIVRWIGPGLFKAIGQGRITSFQLKLHDRTVTDQPLCFEYKRKNSEVFFSMMSQEASFVLWTHCNVLADTPPEERLAKMDEIVSAPPPSSYFYVPTFGPKSGEVIDDYGDREVPEWKDEKTVRAVLPQARSPYLWRLKASRDWAIEKKARYTYVSDEYYNEETGRYEYKVRQVP